MAKTGLDPMSIEGLQGTYVNNSITTFARVLENISRTKVVTGGQPLPKDIPWKESTITKIMKSCFDGTAFSSFIICISTADKNSGEAYHSCKFGAAAAGLKSKITKPKQLASKAQMEQIAASIKDINKQLEKANDQTAKRLRGDMAIEEVQLNIFTRLANK